MMTDKLEQVSALADDQWDDDAIEALLSDPELQSRWATHHQVSDAMRGENVTLADSSFADRVSAAIAEEPTVLAPKATSTSSVKVPGKVVRMFRQAGQYAIAATVAAVAIVGVQHSGDESPEQRLPVLNTTPVAGVTAAPVSLNAAAPQTSSASNQAEARERLIEQRRRINAYFQDHELQLRIQQPDLQGNVANQHDEIKAPNQQAEH
ncbi:sigma-E factor negative regulatory protein [Echinimonas agarilytica]|uniref:Anti-sigma-E factor RseA n=1 Tax=Echinimonas agarilytica TaxID=1215918 RepID=A0AA42B6J2_9GAMM|nr:anti sigma-E factor RseA C-terminal domain-containing protein [Echinimonas agarilytica]MCM2678817.1 RseA family anti-sigma factor [Echinimonas agarilytica]